MRNFPNVEVKMKCYYFLFEEDSYFVRNRAFSEKLQFTKKLHFLGVWCPVLMCDIKNVKIILSHSFPYCQADLHCI